MSRTPTREDFREQVTERCMKEVELHPLSLPVLCHDGLAHEFDFSVVAISYGRSELQNLRRKRTASTARDFVVLT